MASRSNNVAPTTDKQGVALNSMFASLALCLGKLLVGLFCGSIAVLAEAAHSGLDFVAALLTVLAVRASDRPSDANHNFGHGRLENMSALAETFLLLVTCAWILYESVHRLLGAPTDVMHTGYAAVMLLVSIAVDISRSSSLRKAAKEHRSQALEADALHFSTDIFSSASALLGVALAWLSTQLHIAWLTRADAIAAILIALVTLGLSWKLGLRSVRVLTDEVPPELHRSIVEAVRAVQGVREPLRVRARFSGSRTFVDVVAHVPGDLPTKDSHSLADQIEEAVREAVSNADVLVHLEPTGAHRSSHE
jgi:cation diffusion facilitator family transporter